MWKTLWLGAAATAARMLVGATFTYAGVLKLLDPARFAEDLANYRIFPSAAVPMLAVTVSGIEVVAGAVLFSGRLLRPAAVVICGMLLGFIAAVASALWRGLDLECGCFGGSGRVDAGLLVRDIVLLISTIFATIYHCNQWYLRCPGKQDT